MALRTCIVSYTDSINFGFKRSVEVVAETLYEAVVLGAKAMEVDPSQLHRLSFEVKVKTPEVYHSISGASLAAWLSCTPKNVNEENLKARLKGLLRS